jgi:hypothetical protein
MLLFNQTSLTGGRYGFSVSFVEYFLKNGLESPHKLLNEYIKALAVCYPGDDGEPFFSGEPRLQIEVGLRGFEWDKLESGRFVLQLQLPIPHFEIR